MVRLEGHRLLAEHRLPGLEGEPDVLVVQGVRRRDVDDVDLGVAHQRLVGAVRRPADSAANALARSWPREPVATSSASGTSARSATNERAIRPGPSTPHPILSTTGTLARHAAGQMTPLYFARL